jgi:hypothetical protein
MPGGTAPPSPSRPIAGRTAPAPALDAEQRKAAEDAVRSRSAREAVVETSLWREPRYFLPRAGAAVLGLAALITLMVFLFSPSASGNTAGEDDFRRQSNLLRTAADMNVPPLARSVRESGAVPDRDIIDKIRAAEGLRDLRKKNFKDPWGGVWDISVDMKAGALDYFDKKPVGMIVMRSAGPPSGITGERKVEVALKWMPSEKPPAEVVAEPNRPPMTPVDDNSNGFMRQQQEKEMQRMMEQEAVPGTPQRR